MVVTIDETIKELTGILLFRKFVDSEEPHFYCYATTEVNPLYQHDDYNNDMTKVVVSGVN